MMNAHENKDNEHPDEIKAENSEKDIDWEKRTLCSDGNCIGVIGPDGRCKECGKKFEGPAPEGSAFKDDIRQAESEADEEEEIIEKKETQDDPDWEKRTLCSDGNCIGVIDSNGRCKECGKPYEG